MIISKNLLEEFKSQDFIRCVEVQKYHNVYEYSIISIPEGSVITTLELDGIILKDISGEVIGHFGIDLDNNVLAYYLL